MKMWKKTLALIIIFLLPIWIDEICKFHPETYYCKTVESYFHDPEPISMGNNDIISFSVSATVQASGVTTTVLPSGTISNSTTTTT